MASADGALIPAAATRATTKVVSLVTREVMVTVLWSVCGRLVRLGRVVFSFAPAEAARVGVTPAAWAPRFGLAYGYDSALDSCRG
jgi:uncharacterized membrane protein YesL